MKFEVGEVLGGSYKIVRPLGKDGTRAVFETSQFVSSGIWYNLRKKVLAMAAFPDTPATMLAKIAAQRTCESEVAWGRFFGLYEPVIRRCAAAMGAGDDSEDVAQEIFIKLVGILREGRYSPSGGKFRSYLTTLIRHELVSRWRKAQVRQAANHVSLDDPDSALEIAVPDSVSAEIDAKWYRARHDAAVDHVLTKTFISRQSKDVYSMYVVDGRPVGEVMERFGLTRNTVYQIKTRVEKMISAVESEMGD